MAVHKHTHACMHALLHLLLCTHVDMVPLVHVCPGAPVHSPGLCLCPEMCTIHICANKHGPHLFVFVFTCACGPAVARCVQVGHTCRCVHVALP